MLGDQRAREDVHRDEAEGAGHEPDERLDGGVEGGQHERDQRRADEQGNDATDRRDHEDHAEQPHRSFAAVVGVGARDRGHEHDPDDARQVQQDLGDVDGEPVDSAGPVAFEEVEQDLVDPVVEEQREAADERTPAEREGLACEHAVEAPEARHARGDVELAERPGSPLDGVEHERDAQCERVVVPEHGQEQPVQPRGDHGHDRVLAKAPETLTEPLDGLADPDHHGRDRDDRERDGARAVDDQRDGREQGRAEPEGEARADKRRQQVALAPVVARDEQRRDERQADLRELPRDQGGHAEEAVGARAGDADGFRDQQRREEEAEAREQLGREEHARATGDVDGRVGAGLPLAALHALIL